MAKPRWVALGAFLAGVTAAVLCGVFFVLGCNLAWIGQRLDAEGGTTPATIVAKDERSRHVNPKYGQPEYTPDYFVTYRFVGGDGTYSFNEARVSASFFRQTSVGASTPVRYLPDNSKRSEVEFGNTSARSFQGILGGGVGVIFGLGLAVVAIVRPRWLGA